MRLVGLDFKYDNFCFVVFGAYKTILSDIESINLERINFGPH